MTEYERGSVELPHEVRWETVLDEWRAAEEEQWAPVFRERGFGSWWEWRKSYVAELGIERRKWNEAIARQPHETIPALAIGGYRGWKAYRPAGKDVATYADVARPVAAGELSYAGTPRVDVRTNQKVMDLVGTLRDTTILVLRCPSLSVVLDGAHRCAATAVEAENGTVRSPFQARLRFCEFRESERTLLEAFARDRVAATKSLE